MKRTSFLGVSSKRSYRSSQKHSTSASSALPVGAQTWITVILNGLPWKQTEIILSLMAYKKMQNTDTCHMSFLFLLNELPQSQWLYNDTSVLQVYNGSGSGHSNSRSASCCSRLTGILHLTRLGCRHLHSCSPFWNSFMEENLSPSLPFPVSRGYKTCPFYSSSKPAMLYHSDLSSQSCVPDHSQETVSAFKNLCHQIVCACVHAQLCLNL